VHWDLIINACYQANHHPGRVIQLDQQARPYFVSMAQRFAAYPCHLVTDDPKVKAVGALYDLPVDYQPQMTQYWSPAVLAYLRTYLKTADDAIVVLPGDDEVIDNVFLQKMCAVIENQHANVVLSAFYTQRKKDVFSQKQTKLVLTQNGYLRHAATYPLWQDSEQTFAWCQYPAYAVNAKGLDTLEFGSLNNILWQENVINVQTLKESEHAENMDNDVVCVDQYRRASRKKSVGR